MGIQITKQWQRLCLEVCLYAIQAVVYGVGVLLLCPLWASIVIFVIVILGCSWSAIQNFRGMVKLEFDADFGFDVDEVCSSTTSVLKSFAISLAFIGLLTTMMFIAVYVFPVRSTGLHLSDMPGSTFMFTWLAPIGLLIGASSGSPLAHVIYVVTRKRKRDGTNNPD
jgi:hypothetical protein